MSYGPGPTPPGGYDPSNQYGYPPPGDGVPPSYPPNAPVGGYPQDQYGGPPAVYPAASMPPQGMPPAGGPPGYGPYPGGPGYPPPTNNGLKIALIALVAILVLGGAGVGTYFLLQKDDKPTASPAVAPTQANSGKEDKQGEQQGGGQDRDQRDDSEESANPYPDFDDDQTTPTPNIDPDHEAPTTGNGDLPTGTDFVPLPRNFAPAKVGDFDAFFTPESTSYQRQTDWAFFSVEWAKLTPAELKDEMRFHEELVNFGDIQCGKFVFVDCFAPHPQHPDVWLEVSGLGESAEDTSAFTKMLLEKLP